MKPTEELTEVQLKEQQLKAHQFQESIVPYLIPPVTDNILKYIIMLIEERRQEIKDELRPIEENDTEMQRAKKEKANKHFIDYQSQWLTVGSDNIRQIVWHVAGALTAFYYPALLKAQQEQQKRDNGDQAPVSEETPRGGSISIPSAEVVGRPVVQSS